MLSVRPGRDAAGPLDRSAEPGPEWRLRDLGQFAAVMAHEVSQPITAAMNYLYTAMACLPSPSLPEGEANQTAAHEVLMRAVFQLSHAGRIVGRLRSLLSGDEPDRSSVGLHELLHEALEMSHPDLERAGAGASLSMSADLPGQVFLDRVQIVQVLHNLLRNASEAVAGCPCRSIAISAAPVGVDQVVIRIEDSGTGVAPEIGDRLFEPFVTSKAGGMGLGLSICRSITEAHGGRLEAASSPAGCRMSLTLPVGADEADF